MYVKIRTGPINGLNRTKPWFEFTFLHLNCVFMLNWIARNRTVLTSTLCTYTKLNYLKWHCFDINSMYCPVSWGGEFHRLRLSRGVGHPPNDWPGCDTGQSGCRVPVMLELWGMQSTFSLPLPPGLLWPEVVTPGGALSVGWVELDTLLVLIWVVWIGAVWLDWMAWNRNVFDN